MKWTNTFRYLPINFAGNYGMAGPETQTVSFDNNLNGERIRVRFSNKFSDVPLILSDVTISADPAPERGDAFAEVTRDGKNEVVLQPHEECFSDAITFPVHAGQRLTVTIVTDREQPIGSVCTIAARNGAAVNNCLSKDPEIDLAFYGFCAVEVLSDVDATSVVAFGDSITHMSFVTNALYKRLYEAYPGTVALSNAGIGGNRLLRDPLILKDRDDTGSHFGIAGLTRFEEDVFGAGPADVVLVLIGINDIMHPFWYDMPEEAVTSAELAKAYEKLVETAHRHGAKIYGATLTPSISDEYPREQVAAYEKTRQEINDRIRAGIFDDYFDYDAAVRDEADPARMKDGRHIGDGLHPNGVGGREIAETVNLKKLVKK